MAVIALSLSACGGGGSSNSTAAPSNQTAVAITQANMKQVASAALRSDIRAISAFGGGVVGVVPIEPMRQTNATLLRVLREIPNRVVRPASSALLVPSAIVREGDPIPCGTEESPSGFFSIKFDDKDGNNDYGVGESVEVTFHDCLDATEGTTSNGNLKFTFTSLEGFSKQPIAPWRYGANFTFSAFQLRSPGASPLNIDGAIQWSESQLNTDESTVVASGTRLDANRVEENLSITDFTVTFDDNNRTNAYRQFGQQTYVSSKLGGAFRMVVTETLPLSGSSRNFAESGVITVHGKNSSISLVAINRTNVRIDLDSNFDGVIDDSELVRWSDLSAL